MFIFFVQDSKVIFFCKFKRKVSNYRIKSDKGSSIYYIRKIFQKTNILTP